MKEIKAIIHPHMVHKVVQALRELEHFPGFTLLDARGQGEVAVPAAPLSLRKTTLTIIARR